MLQKSFFSVAVSRIVRNGNGKKFNYFKAKTVDKPDAYDICIKAKAIARSSGANQALSYSLNQQGSLIKSSRPVLLNTVLAALGAEGKKDRFWEVVESKIEGKSETWSPELVATLLNQIAKEMQGGITAQEANTKAMRTTCANELLMQRATHIYIEALEKLKDPSHPHIHNAYLKCISRHPNISYLLWIINEMTRGHFRDIISTELYGVKEYLPVSEASLKLSKLFSELKKPVELDSQSLTSILSTLSRSAEGGSLIQLAESVWSKFQNANKLDSHCHMALLLVYRNDLSRIFNTRKLIRSTSWRQRKLDRVLEIIKDSGVDLALDPKTLSIYFEICLNARLKEKIGEFVAQNPRIKTRGDMRLLDLISRNSN